MFFSIGGTDKIRGNLTFQKNVPESISTAPIIFSGPIVS
jgi:hypothetical protein